MSRKLGKRELDQLRICAVPTTIMLNPNRVTDRLIERGLLQRDGTLGVCITSDGLRYLASALDSGELQGGLELARSRREAMA